MKSILKYLGVFIVLIGVIVLVVYYYGGSNSNAYLSIAALLMIAGLVSHIFINKKIQ